MGTETPTMPDAWLEALAHDVRFGRQVDNADVAQLIADVRTVRAVLNDLLLTRQAQEEAYAADNRLDDEDTVDDLTCRASYERVKAAEQAHEAAWDRARSLLAGEEKP